MIDSLPEKPSTPPTRVHRPGATPSPPRSWGKLTRLLAQLLAVGAPDSRGVGENGAELGGLLVDGLRAVACEQPHGRLVGQLRGGDVGGGRDGKAGFLDGHVDEV